MTRSETTSTNIMIRGTCFINGIQLIAIIDKSATHSFILLDYAQRLDSKLFVIVGSMLIDTPTNS